MSEPVQPLGGASYSGFATVREIGPLGMVTLRAKPDAAGLADAIGAVAGTPVPGQRRVETSGGKSVAWMSPDEYLIFGAYRETAAMIAAIEGAMAGSHHLAVPVSDARAVFRVEGQGAAEVLSKLAPVDFATLPLGEMRRTRLAQVAAALWRDETGFTLVVFRSVARYAFDLMANAAKAGTGAA